MLLTKLFLALLRPGSMDLLGLKSLFVTKKHFFTFPVAATPRFTML